MQAIILAGGFATRLRPLSCSKPKLLFPIVGLPLIDRMITWLRQVRIDTLVLAVNHFSDRLALELGSSRYGSKIIFSVEQIPLGTGGPLRLAQDRLQMDQPFLVINGDIVTDIDLSAIISLHHKENAEVTIGLVKVRDPRPYGTASLDKMGRIVRFVEKGSQKTGTPWINAGVYVLNPSIIKRIRPGRFVSLEREIFPDVAHRLKMQGWKHDGMWYDIGNIRDYTRANMRLLQNPTFLKGSRRSGIGRESEKRIRPPIFVGRNSVIHPQARLGPNTILSDRVEVNSGSSISNTIVFEETSIGRNCNIRGSIIGEHVTIGDGIRIGAGSIVSGQIRLKENSKLRPNSVILN